MKKKSLFLFLNALLINAFGQGIGESHFGVHTGSLSFNSAATYIDSLGSQIYVRRGFPIADDYGWYYVKSSAQTATCLSNRDTTRCPTSICDCSQGSYYYSKPAARIPLPILPAGITNPFIDILINRYDSNIPTTLDSTRGDYPHGHETEYIAFVDYLLQGYQNTAVYWEVGNENDAESFWSGTQQEYADIVALSSGEIRNSCSVCKVGISFARPDICKSCSSVQKHEWYQKMNSVIDTFDFVDVHYYYPSFILTGQLDSFKLYCPGKEFISTETGIPDNTDPNYVGQNAGGSLVKQAQDLIKYNTLMFAEGYSKIYWYLKDTYFGSGQDIFLHNALIDEASTTPKPAFYSYKTMINKVDSFSTITKLATGQYRYDFTNKGSVYVLWCDFGTSILPAAISDTVKVTDYMGNVQTIQASQIVLDSIPIFVELGLSSINENNISHKHLSIYPNPFNETTTIEITNEKNQNYELKIFDVFGKTLYQSEITNQKSEIHLDLLNGIYFLQVIGNNFIQTKKIEVII